MYTPQILYYDWDTYLFGARCEEMLKVDDLTSLRGEDYGVTGLVNRERDQSSDLHKRFYDRFEEVMEPAYRTFAADMASQIFFPDETVYYQRVPTFRVSFPGNMAVGELHTDADYGHQDGVLNVWVPLTPAYGSNSIWIERGPGTYFLRSWALGRGEALVFDGVNWVHGNRRNRTRISRVSFDFRLIPASRYQETNARSINIGRRLTLGEYYGELSR
jgi:hypothetical protein